MSQKTDAVVASTIGIDTGKNTLHLVGLDEQGTIVLREKLPDTEAQDQSPPSLTSDLQHTAGPYKWVIRDRAISCQC
jgi:hypothetical protein